MRAFLVTVTGRCLNDAQAEHDKQQHALANAT